MNDYKQKAMRTMVNDGGPLSRILQVPELIDLNHAALGLCTESAELADVIKKAIYYGKNIDKPNLLEEIGDILWYACIVLDYLDKDFSDAMRVNISKLEKRYPDAFTEEDAIHRDLAGERKILENG